MSRFPDAKEATFQRLLYTITKDFRSRHCGVLRTPAELTLFAQYRRQQIINHFGEQYDPAKHNMGIMRFGGNNFVIICKLDTSSAKECQKYENQFIDDRTFEWTSQNKMSPESGLGREVLDRKNFVHLFVQPTSHAVPVYVGKADPQGVRGAKPMMVTFALTRIPEEVRRQLEKKPAPKTAKESIPIENTMWLRCDQVQPFLNAVPVYPLHASAGNFSIEQILVEGNHHPELTPEIFDWYKLEGKESNPKDLFVMQVIGESMNKIIPNGSWCLFRFHPKGTRQEKIVLAWHAGTTGDQGGCFSVKKYRSEKIVSEDSFVHTAIWLEPCSTDSQFYPLEIPKNGSEDFRILAEFIRIVK